jgi:DNA polymerase-1
VTAPVGFDCETARADDLFAYGPEFVRLSGWTHGDDVKVETDPHELIRVLNDAPWIYGHNIFGFDLLALAHYYGADWDKLSAKAVDTLLLARLDWPPQARDTGGSIDKYDLDHVAERLGVPGKTDSIRDLARKHGGYDHIPLDDPEYRDYLTGDVKAVAALVNKLPRTDYAKREHRCASLMGRMTLNGFRVDIPLLNERISRGEETKREALEILRDDYDLPLGKFVWKGRGDKKEESWQDFDSPLATLEGREWFLYVLDGYGVLNPPVTETGRLATAADALAPLADSDASHPDLRRILRLMQTVTTTRTVYQTVADHLVGDRVYPLINMGQASGRSSVTSPGLTVFGKRGGRHIERDIFIPEPGHVLVSCDLSQVDMRAVAALSQDPAYMKLFEGDQDAHKLIALQIFGTEDKRFEAKAIGHGWNYGLGANKLIASGFDPELVRAFFENMERSYPRVCSWKNEVRAIGAAGKLLDNGFGRKMRCDPARAYTQAPALMGQGAAADILKTALLRLPDECRPMLRLMIHDEILLDVPKDLVEDVRRTVMDAFTFEWRGVQIKSDCSAPGSSWGQVSAK